METSVKGIIEKIKKEGVEKAREEAAAIIANANEESRRILKEAREKEAAIMKEAEKEAEKMRTNAQAAIRQAARDAKLGLRASITALFDSVMKREISRALDQETIKKMMVLLSEKFDPGKEGGIEAMLGEKDKKDLQEIFAAALGREMASGVTLSCSKEITGGFRIGKKDEGVYYDFTDEAISEALGTFLNKGILSILSEEKK